MLHVLRVSYLWIFRCEFVTSVTAEVRELGGDHGMGGCLDGDEKVP